MSAPACPRCHSPGLRARGWQLPKGWRTELRTLYERARKQRVYCAACGRYSHLPPGRTIPAQEGRPKVSRRVCECGSTDLRPAGWSPDGRQKAECNCCGSEFNLPLGMLISGKPTDTLGRPIRYTNGHSWKLPDPAAEAQAMLHWCLRTYGPYAPTRLAKLRTEIAVSREDRALLEAFARTGYLDASEVRRAIAFREKVLEEFDRLVEGA
jgi:hypothetical protein